MKKPTPVPKLICETRDDKVRYLEGKLRREMRSVMNVNQQRMSFGFMNATDEQLNELISSDSLV